jgi:hypothetical protein
VATPTTTAGISVNGLYFGDFVHHPFLYALDCHRRDTAPAARTSELDGHLAGFPVKVLDRCRSPVHFDLWEVLLQEGPDFLT